MRSTTRRLAALSALVALALPCSATAAWIKPPEGAGASQAKILQAGNTPATSVAGRNVTVSWSASTLSGGGAIDGYRIKRYNGSGSAQTVGSSCSGTIAALTCIEQGVPPGSWRYSVTPMLANWRGAESAQSAAVAVSSPLLSLNASSTTALPATFTGQITNFTGGQTVSFRLDNQASGPSLAGSINPSQVPNDGTATVSVILPAGTANGPHTIFAIGNGGDVASAAVNVNVPNTTVATTAWTVGDASSGAEVAANAGDAVAGDGRFYTSGKFGAFSTSRYIEAQMNAPVPAGATVSAASFTFSFAPANPNDTACFYFEARRISTGALIATHGSAAAPVACASTLTQVSTTTPLPAVSSAAIANDLAIRIYASNSGGGGKSIIVDRATVSATVSGQAYTLQSQRLIDAATGTGSTTFPWGLAVAGDGANLQTAGTWTASFAPGRYLKLTFPTTVPSGATINSVGLRHNYRSAAAGTTCWYFEIYSGTTLLANKGSAATPVSCTSSTTAFQADTVPLPEVNTAGKANGLIVKMFLNSSGAAASQHDLAELSVNYSG